MVVDQAGLEVGSVDEVAGDTEDIFDGLAVATSAFGKPRYVPAEQVAEVEADNKSGFGEQIGADLREVEGKVLAPVQTHEHSMNIWRRILLFFRRLRG